MRLLSFALPLLVAIRVDSLKVVRLPREEKGGVFDTTSAGTFLQEGQTQREKGLAEIGGELKDLWNKAQDGACPGKPIASVAVAFVGEVIERIIENIVELFQKSVEGASVPGMNWADRFGVQYNLKSVILEKARLPASKLNVDMSGKSDRPFTAQLESALDAGFRLRHKRSFFGWTPSSSGLVRVMISGSKLEIGESVDCSAYDKSLIPPISFDKIKVTLGRIGVKFRGSKLSRLYNSSLKFLRNHVIGNIRKNLPKDLGKRILDALNDEVRAKFRAFDPSQFGNKDMMENALGKHGKILNDYFGIGGDDDDDKKSSGGGGNGNSSSGGGKKSLGDHAKTFFGGLW
uniref:Lipid-binding serum glycoprotein N-terminal domain-containing protein n=1 Tax=Chromera velia CCMP2878 TaxID=1169474 RepID=A0A0G4GXZ6_9ALVE|eukprot:Cvel_5380.t1-p1 / transcript=Cvel_5380.t1 / gene=Cvel_5380 / organism=Chromera_velia_CCMP2878 / gene_product=hypothetical protein / transcript_product=hypothetical protein / location=Cvel_scaffold250:46319-47353(+) / protein_length=345 / sequence_SO=supercontig / SO=protein_coding / is_pseudo=false